MKSMKVKLIQDILFIAKGNKQKREQKIIARLDGMYKQFFYKPG